MSAPYTSIEEEVMDYLFEQKMRERDLQSQRDELKTNMNKIEEQLGLLQDRDDDQTCMIATGNLYQLSNVKQVKEALLANLTACMQPYLKLHRKLTRLQRNISEDHTVLYVNYLSNPSN